MQQEKRRRYLIGALLRERGDDLPDAIPTEEEDQRRLLRGLMNVRPPAPVSRAFLQVQDAYLQEDLAERGVTCAGDLRPLQEGICLWRGGYHHAPVRSHRQRGQQRHDRLLPALPRLH